MGGGRKNGWADVTRSLHAGRTMNNHRNGYSADRDDIVLHTAYYYGLRQFEIWRNWEGGIRARAPDFLFSTIRCELWFVLV